jgi:hypothetical protein
MPQCLSTVLANSEGPLEKWNTELIRYEPAVKRGEQVPMNIAMSLQIAVVVRDTVSAALQCWRGDAE